MNGSLWGHDALKAGDVVAEPLSGAGRGTLAAGDALGGTGLLGEGTDSGGAEVVKGGGGEASDTALVGLANGVGLLVHLGGGEAVSLVGGVPVVPVGDSAEGFCEPSSRRRRHEAGHPCQARRQRTSRCQP